MNRGLPETRGKAAASAEQAARRLVASLPVFQPPQSLSGGAAGIALLPIERATSNPFHWPQAHAWLSLAAGDDVTAEPAACLFHGAPAIAFALQPVHQPGYRQARGLLDQAVENVIRYRLAAAALRLRRGDRPALAEFDLISGLTGLGAHLWRKDPHHRLIDDILRYLVRLTEPIDGLPGWWSLSPIQRNRPEPAGGHSNHGMAHGITGPLAFLAISSRAGRTIPGQRHAIDRILHWLDDWQQTHQGHPWWPETVSLRDVHRAHPEQHRPLRPSWCYGTPGIARAQQLAALALVDPDRQATAEAAVTGCLTDPRQLHLITDRSLCHGAAGLYMTVSSLAADALSPLPDVAADLLLKPFDIQGEPPGFLTGTAGHALALHALASGEPPATAWDTALLLR
ncbi:lanthionine synthetase C family protein [Streptosporangium saharense]|uniref:lanthionine synthetase C family protein n=1 Tax=Streptosporangium saharense TaxID=1706840 RepID=UPI00331EFDF5